MTFFAKINQVAGTSGYLVFYGTSTTRPNFSLFLDNSAQSLTFLTLQYISREDNQLQNIRVQIPSVAGAEHCLTIVFQQPLNISVDDELADLARVTLPDLDLTTGVSYMYSHNVTKYIYNNFNSCLMMIQLD